MYDKQKVIDLALSQVGYHEQGNNLTKYAADLDTIKGFYNGPKNGYAWCDVFVDWCFVKSYGVVGAKELLCQPDNSCGAGCSFSADYFRQHGRFYTSNPQTGDQIFFSYRAGEVSHTGLVVAVDGNTVTTVEGNTSDMVAKRSYSISDGKIYGYGRPDWGAETVDESPEDQGVIVVDPPAGGDTNVSTTPATDMDVGGKKVFTIELRYLRKGDKGEDVRAMQGALIARGCSCGKWGADGDIGNDTYAALRAFQNRNGLTMDGEFGPKTATKLYGGDLT